MPKQGLSRVQVNRSLDRLQSHLSPISLERLRKVTGLLSDETSRTTAAEVQRSLFAGAGSGAANKSLQRLRSELANAAHEADVVIELRITEARSIGAELREVWFEGELPPLDGMNLTEELERVGEALIADVQGTPLGNVEPRLRVAEQRDGKPLVRLFISYAHADGGLPHKLVEDLKPRLSSSSKYAFEVWRDIELLPGEDWDKAIRGALGEAHLGLLLLSPHFFASNYIGNVEIPIFVSGRGEGVEGKRVIPVELEQLDFANTHMRGLAARQVFRGPTSDKCPFPRRSSAKRTAWMNALVKAIHEILDQHADTDPVPPLSPPPGKYFPRARNMLSADLDGVERLDCLIEDTLAQATHLDASLLDRPGEKAPTSVHAVHYIMDWLRDDSGPPLFALLGEYGMGKTITCQRVVRAIERQNTDGDEALPSPLYFDLRRLTSLRGRDQVPTLTEVIDECIERGWPVLGAKPSAKELLEQASQQPMAFVFDGLDEALVHLSESHGREFTRELLRVRELGQRAGAKTRVLLSCRTHFFRSLQEQDSHFTGQDRGRTTAKDYAALVLLPLGANQIQRYLERALPEIDVARATELVRSVHNLEELAARPYTLQLISEQIPKIEELRARGESVRGVTLYRLMVDKWLNRDGGKHHIKPHHKRKLMSHLASWTWSRGTRFVPASELEDWFGEWVESDPAMRRRYADVGFDKLEEDLRTATFLVREDDQAGQTLGFRFAHTSMQEFFLSSFLFDALVDDAPERWNFENVSSETWDFFMQHLVERGGGDLVARMSKWAKGERREVRWLVFRYVIEGHQRGWPMPVVRGIDLSDIQLQECRLRGPLDLSGSRWARANLRQVRWQDITVDDACFEDADLRFTEWDSVKAERASFERAQADGGVFRRVAWDSAKGSGSMGRRCSFIHTRPPGFWLEDALVAPRVGLTIEDRAVRSGLIQRVQSCIWSPDGTRALLGGEDGTLRVWDVASGASLGVWQGHQGRVWSCAWSPDGKRALSAGEDGTLGLWDAASGASLGVWQGHQGRVWSCAWSPDGKRALSAGEDKTLRLWDVASGVSLGAWQGHKGGVRSCAWSPDGKRALSAGEDKTLRLWDAASGASLGVWQGHQNELTSCTWSPDGKRALSAGSDGTLRLWDVASGTSLGVWQGHGGWLVSCAWSQDGKRALLGGEDGTLGLWDVASGTSLGVWRGHWGGLRSCAWSPDGKRALSAGEDKTLRLWDVASGVSLGVWEGDLVGIWSCAWSPDGKRALSAGHDGMLRLWDVASGASLEVWQGHPRWVWSCAWSPDGKRALSAGSDGTLRLWDVASGMSLGVWQGHGGWLTSCAWSPDGKRALAACHDGTLQLWDVASGASLGVWQGHLGSVWSCAWSPDGKRALSAGDDGTPRLWDVASGESLGVWQGHTGSVWSCAWSPDGKQALSAGHDGTLRLWDVASGASLGVLQGHRGRVRSCTWSPDGKRALSAGHDGTLRLWDVASGASLGVWQGDQGGIWSCAWSPDGKRALSAGHDGTLRIWDVEMGVPTLVMAELDGSHASYIPGSHADGGRVIEASEGAWRWLRWQVRYEDGATDLLPAESFGELPPPRGQS